MGLALLAWVSIRGRAGSGESAEARLQGRSRRTAIAMLAVGLILGDGVSLLVSYFVGRDFTARIAQGLLLSRDTPDPETLRPLSPRTANFLLDW